MMRKHGVENVNEHFLSFNTICDATQVSFSNLLWCLLSSMWILGRECGFVFYILLLHRQVYACIDEFMNIFQNWF